MKVAMDQHDAVDTHRRQPKNGSLQMALQMQSHRRQAIFQSPAKRVSANR